jgi:hypothetical protein
MIGGSIAECQIHNTAIFNYLDGEIVWLVAQDDAVVNIHSDYDYGFAMTDYSKVFLHNGCSDLQVLIVSGNAQLHIYGDSLVCTPAISSYIVEGLWEDSQQSFSMVVRYAEGITPQIILHEIPEPISVLLFAFGGLLLRRTRK